MTDEERLKVLRLTHTPERIVVPIPQTAHDRSKGFKFYSPDRVWLGIEWPDGNLTVHTLTDEESERWLNGEDIHRENA